MSHSPLVAGADAAVVAGQLGRPPHAMSAVSARCPYGFPAVVEDLPYDADGRPFPTLYYCTCPTLVAAVSRLESDGGVARWTARLAEDPSAGALGRGRGRGLGRPPHRPRARVRARRWWTAAPRWPPASAAWPTCSPSSACTRTWRTRWRGPGYVLGDAVLTEVADPWCDDRRCAAFVPDGEEPG